MHNRILINSSVIAAIAYSDEAALDVEFSSGATYVSVRPSAPA